MDAQVQGHFARQADPRGGAQGVGGLEQFIEIGGQLAQAALGGFAPPPGRPEGTRRQAQTEADLGGPVRLHPAHALHDASHQRAGGHLEGAGEGERTGADPPDPVLDLHLLGDELVRRIAVALKEEQDRFGATGHGERRVLDV